MHFCLFSLQGIYEIYKSNFPPFYLIVYSLNRYSLGVPVGRL